MAKNKRPKLSELERVVMNVVWETGDVTADQIRVKLAKSNPMKDSTVRTILRRLESKGYLDHTTEGRTFIYTAIVAQPNVAAEAVLGIVDKFCSGSVEKLLIGMVENKVLTPEKLQQLADKIAQAEQAQSSSKSKTASKSKRTNTNSKGKNNG